MNWYLTNFGLLVYIILCQKFFLNQLSNKLFFSIWQEGSFEVPLVAVLPQVDISVPDFLDFSMCAAKDSVETIFEVTNTG